METACGAAGRYLLRGDGFADPEKEYHGADAGVAGAVCTENSNPDVMMVKAAEDRV
jgi:hypothetical protein